MLYDKAHCVLHRKFLGRGRENSRYVHSRRACVDASMNLLRFQGIIHDQSQLHTRLRNIRWYVNSLTTSDFLLAATIIALDLNNGNEADLAGRRSSDVDTWGMERREDMIHVLQGSRDIWIGLQDGSIEAYKAGALLTMLIEQLKARRSGSAKKDEQKPPPSFFGTFTADNAQAYGLQEDKPEHSAAMTLGMLQSGRLSPSAANMYDRSYPASSDVISTLPDSQTGLSMPMPVDGGTNVNVDPFSGIFTSQGLMDMQQNIDWVGFSVFITSASSLWKTDHGLGRVGPVHRESKY